MKKVVTGRTPLPIHQMIAALGMPTDYPGRLAKANAILQKCTGNPNVTFTSAQITLLTTNIGTFNTAINNVAAKVAGAVAARNAAYKVVHTQLKAFMAAAQIVADANPANAETIITSCGFNVRKVKLPTSHNFSAKNGDVAGTADLEAKGVKDGKHEWAYSHDNITWIVWDGDGTRKTLVTGLAPLSKVYFRHRVLAQKVYGAWEYTNLNIA